MYRIPVFEIRPERILPDFLRNIRPEPVTEPDSLILVSVFIYLRQIQIRTKLMMLNLSINQTHSF